MNVGINKYADVHTNALTHIFFALHRSRRSSSSSSRRGHTAARGGAGARRPRRAFWRTGTAAAAGCRAPLPGRPLTKVLLTPAWRTALIAEMCVISESIPVSEQLDNSAQEGSVLER